MMEGRRAGGGREEGGEVGEERGWKGVLVQICQPCPSRAIAARGARVPHGARVWEVPAAYQIGGVLERRCAAGAGRQRWAVAVPPPPGSSGQTQIGDPQSAVLACGDGVGVGPWACQRRQGARDGVGGRMRAAGWRKAEVPGWLSVAGMRARVLSFCS